MNIKEKEKFITHNTDDLEAFKLVQRYADINELNPIEALVILADRFKKGQGIQPAAFINTVIEQSISLNKTSLFQQDGYISEKNYLLNNILLSDPNSSYQTYINLIELNRHETFKEIDSLKIFNLLKDHKDETLTSFKITLLEDMGYLNDKNYEEQGRYLYNEDDFIDIVQNISDDYRYFDEMKKNNKTNYLENTKLLTDQIMLINSLNYWSAFDIEAYSKYYFPDLDKVFNSNISKDIIDTYAYRTSDCFDTKLLNMYKLDIFDELENKDLIQAAFDHQLDFFQLKKLFEYKAEIFEDEQFLYDIFNDFSYEINNSDCIVKVVKLEAAFKDLISDMSLKLNTDIFKILDSIEHISDLYQVEKLEFEMKNF